MSWGFSIVPQSWAAWCIAAMCSAGVTAAVASYVRFVRHGRPWIRP